MKHLPLIAAAAAAFAFALPEAGANDLLKVIDTINKVVDNVGVQEAGVSNIQVSAGFANGEPIGAGTVFPTGTKTIYVSYTATGSSTGQAIQAAWHQSKNGVDSRIYTMSSVMPKSGVVGEFHLGRQDSSWPVGVYRVDLVLGTKVVGTVSFTVAESQGSGNSGVWGSASSSAAPVVQAPGVKDVVAATGCESGKAVGAASSFQQGIKTVYVVFTATGPSSGVKVQSLWHSVNASGAATKIATLNSTLPAAEVSGEFHLSISGGAAWPAGSYKVDLIVNGAVAGSVAFKVEEANAGVWNVSDADQTTTATTAASTSGTASTTAAPATTTTAAPAKTAKQPSKAQKALDEFFK